MALHAMIPPLPLGRRASSWLHEKCVARHLAKSRSTILGETPPSTSPDAADLPLQTRVHLV